MDILVVGAGGREHALAWKLKQSSRVKNIFIAPGNAGTSQVGQNIPHATTSEIIAWLRKNRVELVIIGPDQYLADGIVDKIRRLKIPVFGPSKAAAKIEWSKSFAKRFMQKEKIPTAAFKEFSNLQKAKEYIKNHSYPLVVKADGLAAGKGVVVARTEAEAIRALDQMMKFKVFGRAGVRVLIEEFLTGREISVHAFSDGESIALFPAAQDHKRAYNSNHGPNTGGMGSIATLPSVSKKDMAEIRARLVVPTIRALARRGTPFVGVLFPGVMLTADGPKVIEFNARFGDPETQSYMRLLATDLAEILLACATRKLKNITIKWSKDSACCIVLASKGYPGHYKTGKEIRGLDKIKKSNSIVVFHAGTKELNNKIFTAGGRVLGITAVGPSLQEALKRAYTAVGTVEFSGKHFRTDIGYEELKSIKY